MPRPGLITATLFTLASLAALGSEAGVLSLRETLLAIPVTEQLGGDGTRPIVNGDAFTFQTPNSPKAHQRPFSFGNRLFNTNWVEAPGSVKAFDGLGPMFNRVSCSGCHTKDGRGRPPENKQGPMESMGPRLISGGRPRPSLVWQPEQETRLNMGPRPSKTFTEPGASTQLVLNRRLPKEKGRWWRFGLLGVCRANAFSEKIGLVPPPPN